MSAQTKITLFTGIEGFEEADTLAKAVKQKRVHFKKPTYRKVYQEDIKNDTQTQDLKTWGEMKELYKELADFSPVLFDNREIIEDNGIRIWQSDYGTFKIVEAEIIGTEDLNIDERLYLHETLLRRLKEGIQLNQALNDLLPVIKLIKQGKMYASGGVLCPR